MPFTRAPPRRTAASAARTAPTHAPHHPPPEQTPVSPSSAAPLQSTPASSLKAAPAAPTGRVSTGLHALDAALGGRGIGTGSVLLVLSGRLPSTANSFSQGECDLDNANAGEYMLDGSDCATHTLARYFAAEACARGEDVLWIGGTQLDADNAVSTIPADAGSAVRVAARMQADFEESSGTLEARGALAESATKNAGKQQQKHDASRRAGSLLDNAWQYEKYLSDASGTGASIPRSKTKSATGVVLEATSDSLVARRVQRFAHTFDLSLPSSPRELEALGSNISSFGVSSDAGLGSDTVNSYARALDRITQALTSNRAPRPLRLVLSGMGDEHWTPRSHSSASWQHVGAFMHALRGLLRNHRANLPVHVMITASNLILGAASVVQMREYSDTIVTLSSLVAPEGDRSKLGLFAPYDGEMLVEKLPALDSLRSAARPETLSYVYVRRRRKLHIKVLDVAAPDNAELEAPKSDKFPTRRKRTQQAKPVKPGNIANEF